MKTKFFTGKGDKGMSGLGGKMRPKNDPLFAALGALDSANSYVGWCAVSAEPFPELRADLLTLQNMLFVAQAELAALGFDLPRAHHIADTHIASLEAMIMRADEAVPPLTSFVLPGGSELAARLDIARAAARDAERALIAFHMVTPCSQELLAWFNRLSSALFAFARFANTLQRVKESSPSYNIAPHTKI